MTFLNPKAQFLQEETLKKELAVVANSSNFHKCLTYAMAAFTITRAPSPEAINGVHDFLDVLLNLPEEEIAPKTMQSKTLDYGKGQLKGLKLQ